jgi:tetratricopeptide (TPR) repeat protein/predicted Ser/Thr protein kinase
VVDDDTTLSDGLRPGRPHALERGDEVGRYIVLERIGAGGMGVVYSAYDPQLDRRVGVKLLRPSEDRADDARHKRLLREAQAMAKLAHPNVITVHDVGTYDDQVFIAMEHVDGKTLGEWMDQSHDWRATLSTFLRAARGLAAAHAAGLVHRDFKPDNVLVGEDGRVRVMDFGLARPADSEDTQPISTDTKARPHFDALATPVTRTGALVGTPAYMAPEQHLGLPTDERCDQFAACVVLYEALYGRRPFAGDTLPALALSVTQGKVEKPPSSTRVPQRVHRSILKGLGADPSSRFTDMNALIDELERAVAPKRRWMLGVAALLALGIGAILFRPSHLDMCDAEDDRLAGTWDDRSRLALADTYGAIDKPWATAAHQSVRRTLEEHAESWVMMAGDSCRATRVERQQPPAVFDLRDACLERRRTELGALVDTLNGGDPKAAENGPRAAAELIPVSVCADIERLQAPIPLPDDPKVSSEVEALRLRLAGIKAATDARVIEGVLERATGVVEEAIATEHLPVVAEAYLERARAHRAAGNREESIDDFYAAATHATESRHDVVAAESWAALIYAVAYRTKRFEEGLVLAKIADGAIARIGRPPDLEATMLANLGSVYWYNGKYELARPNQERALELREQLYGKDSPRISSSLNNLAALEGREGREDLARAHLMRSLKILEATHGPRHPALASTLFNLASSDVSEHDFESAHAHCQRAITLLEEAYGPDHVKLGIALFNDGEALEGLERYSEALQQFERVYTIWKGDRGADHADTLAAARRAGDMQREMGELEAALETWSAALPDHEKRFGADQGHTPRLRLRIARALVDLGRTKEAHERLTTLSEALEDSRDVATLARARFQVARIGRMQGDPRADELAAEARATVPDDAKYDPVREEIDRWLEAAP